MKKGTLVAIVKGVWVNKYPIGITLIDEGKLSVRVHGGNRLQGVQEECLFPLATDCSSLSVKQAIETKLPNIIGALTYKIAFLQEQIDQHKQEYLCHEKHER